MNKTFLTVLALSCTMTANVAAQEYKGSAPVSGATYNLYNVGTKQFLGIENGRLVLGGEKVDVTLSAVNDTNTPGFFRLTSPDGTWHADLYGTPSLETDKVQPVAHRASQRQEGRLRHSKPQHGGKCIALSLSERSARTSRCRTAAALNTV